MNLLNYDCLWSRNIQTSLHEVPVYEISVVLENLKLRKYCIKAEILHQLVKIH